MSKQCYFRQKMEPKTVEYACGTWQARLSLSLPFVRRVIEQGAWMNYDNDNDNTMIPGVGGVLEYQRAQASHIRMDISVV